MNRRQFLKRSTTGLAALSSSSLVTMGGRFRSQENVKQSAALDAAAIRKWASHLHGEVILPGDRVYELQRLVWNRAFDRHPGFIVRCAEVSDVVKAVEFARTHDLLAAVRSGGHSLAGHSVCDGGVVVDLGAMKNIKVDSANRIVHAGAGVRVRELDRATQARGLATPSGGCPEVGIAGLTLGGGETNLIAKYGTACDNLLSADVVTADGRVLTVSSEENPDLFWAVRGGGGNFGVATSFKYRLYPVTKVLAGMLAVPLSRCRDALRGYRDFMRTAPDELKTSGGLIPTGHESIFGILVCYCGDPKKGEKVIGALQSRLGSKESDVKMMSYLEYQSTSFVAPPAAGVATGLFLPELADAVIDVIASHLASAPPASMAVWNDFHGAVTRRSVGEMAFPLREPGYDLFLISEWHTPAGKKAASEWVTRFRTALRPFSRGAYVNNLGDEGESRAREAYGANYERLAELKNKYDPTNFFRLNQNIAPHARQAATRPAK